VGILRTLRDVYARARIAIAPTRAIAIGLLVGAAAVEIWRGADVEEDAGGVEVVEIVAVEAGNVMVGAGAVTVEETGTKTEVYTTPPLEVAVFSEGTVTTKRLSN